MNIYRQGCRWFVKSALGFLAGIALLAFWVELVGIRPEVAVIANHVVISIAMYGLTDQWVFSEYESPTGLRGHAMQYVSFQGVMLASNAAKYVLFVVLVWLGVWYLLAWTIGAVLLFAFSFLGNRRLWSTVSERGQLISDVGFR